MGNRPVPVTKYWHRPWDARLQEEWYRKFSTLFYSMDCVQGVTCWSLSDEPAQWAEFLAGLCELTEEWNLKTGDKLRPKTKAD